MDGLSEPGDPPPEEASVASGSAEGDSAESYVESDDVNPNLSASSANQSSNPVT